MLFPISCLEYLLLLQLRRRRICRRPEPVMVAHAAATNTLAPGAAGATAGDEADITPAAVAAAGDMDEDGNVNQICCSITGEALDKLLLGRYSAKYKRMGLPEKMPGRIRWKKLEAAEAQAAAATDVAEAAKHAMNVNGAANGGSWADGVQQLPFEG